MSDARPGLGQRLIDLTAAFFEAKLRLRPGKVSVLEEDEGIECRDLLRLAPGDSNRPVSHLASSSPRLDRGRAQARKSS